jgi:hypothetical protein
MKLITISSTVLLINVNSIVIPTSDPTPTATQVQPTIGPEEMRQAAREFMNPATNPFSGPWVKTMFG